MELYRSDSAVGKALLEYEYGINKLKRDYCRLQENTAAKEKASEQQQDFTRRLKALRKLLIKEPALATAVSSFFAVPTYEIPTAQRIIHRIWLGGLPPPEVEEAVRQWFSAIHHVVPGRKNAFRQILWVWNKEQIAVDPRFRGRKREDPFQLGEMITAAGSVQVNSLEKLLACYPESNEAFIHQLHQQHYYATLSDYFRLLILIRYGGVYMDADTLPYKPVGWFLLRPELPAIRHSPAAEQKEAWLSWLNLFLDETGMMMAAKGEPALVDIFTRLNKAYAEFDRQIVPKNAERERQLFELFYGIWREHWGTTFISHEDFCQRYAVFYRQEPEAVLCGVRGMRLLEDIISGEHRPLSESEAGSYRRAVNQLEAVDWTLSEPLMLEQYCEVYSRMEVPRMAYALQMRSDVEHFHYYGVLSRDPVLDRVNRLFEDYLLEKNRRAINSGGFWQPPVGAGATVLQGEDVNAISFADGRESSDEDRKRMARLIFSTSYLEYCSVANPQQMDIVSLQRAQNIDPWLDFITLVLKPGGAFAGFITAGVMSRFKQAPAVCLYREEMRYWDREYDLFVAKNSRDNDYFIASLALEAAERGKGYFPRMLDHIEAQAGRAGATRITLCVWESARAFTLYQRWGFRQGDSSDRWQTLFADRLHFLVKEIGEPV